MMKHKSIRRGHSTKHKRSGHKRSSGKRSSNKRSSNKRSSGKRSSNKRSSGKRSSNKRSSSKRSGHKRSSSKRSSNKRSTKKRITKRRLYGGGDVPPFTASGGTQNSALQQNQRAGTQQAGQNAALRGGGVGGAIGTNCDFNYVAKNASGFCDVGNVANKNIDTLLQMQANGVYDVPKAM